MSKERLVTPSYCYILSANFLLKAKGITQSMSRKATCLDNAVAENFFGLLKTELFYLEKFDSLDQLEKAIVEYIDYYNNCRIKLKLNGDRKSTRLNSSHMPKSRMPSSA